MISVGSTSGANGHDYIDNSNTLDAERVVNVIDILADSTAITYDVYVVNPVSGAGEFQSRNVTLGTGDKIFGLMKNVAVSAGLTRCYFN